MSSLENIKQALDRAAGIVGARPSHGQRVYTSTAVVEDGLACRIEEKSYTLVADLPRSMGGDDSGPTPSALLRAALSSCVAMGVKMWAARKDVAVDRVEVRVETGVDARGQLGAADEVTPGFEDIRILISVDSKADPSTLQEIIQTSLRYSPLIDAFERPQNVTTSIDFNRRGEGIA